MRLRSENGFNIAEVMVAFGILTIGMAGVITMLIQSMQTDRSTMEMRHGDEDAARLIETAKGADGSANYTGLALSSALPQGAFYRLTINQTSVLSFSSATSALNRVDVVVGWGGGANCNANTPDQCRSVTRYWNYLIK